MKKIYQLILVIAMFFSLSETHAQTAFIFGIDKTEPLDSLVVIDAVPANFGKPFPYSLDSMIVGGGIVAVDKNNSSMLCDTVTANLQGKIALIDRGSCFFDIKCFNAWQKGAIAVIVVDTTNKPFVMNPSVPAKASQINIPCVMISKSFGAVLKKKIIAGPNTFGMSLVRPNVSPFDPYAIHPGEWYVPEINFGEGALGDSLATNAAWFTYKPSKSGKINISSCGKGANTSLFVYELSGNSIFPYAKNLSACAKDGTDTTKQAASLTNLAVNAGKTYYIEWNDLASSDAFYFNLSFVKNDSVNVTFNVDMKNETIDPAGVHLAGNFQGWNPATTLCTNVPGTTVWTKTIRVKSDTTYEYKFINGATWGKDESVGGACSANNGNRKIDVLTDDIITTKACFKSCNVCNAPPLVCDVDAIICDDFDKYTVGGLNVQSPNWDVWDSDIANAGDGIVSTSESASGKNSMKIDGTVQPAQDVIFITGEKTTGNYILKHKMFVPKGKKAYYNVQHDITKGKHIWANDVMFYSNGAGVVSVGDKNIGNFTYSQNTWFDVVQNINIIKDTATVTINGKTIGWKWSKAFNGTANTTNTKLGGMDFYADSTFTNFYVDDVQLIQPKNPVTFTVDMKNEKVDTSGVYIAGDFQKAAGFASDWQPNLTKLTKGLGTSWSTTVNIPDGIYQFKYINGNAWGKDESLKNTTCDAGGGNRGTTISGATTLKTVCFAKCFACDVAPVTFTVDLTNETTISKDGVSIAGSFQKAAGLGNDWTPGEIFLKNTGKKYYSVTVAMPVGDYEYKFLNGKAWGTDESVNGSCAAANGNRKLKVSSNANLVLDTVCFKKCYTCDKRAVTFAIDMTNEKTISTDGISLAGNFQKVAGGKADWTAGDIFLKDNGNKIFTTTLVIPAGNYEYKFINGKTLALAETVKGTCVAANGNRKITIGAVDTKTDTSCFRYCVSCKISIATNDAAFEKAINVYPNPAQNLINFEYNFEKNSNLTLNILNTLGQAVFNTTIQNAIAGTTLLDTSHLNNGIYMLQITDEDNRQTVKRIVIQK